MKKYISLFWIVFLLLGILVSCGGKGSELPGDKKESLLIATWNVQTFFDATTTGMEYKEFRDKKYWTRELYLERLKRLSGAIKEMDPDLIVLQEIENVNVLHDLYNFLSDQWSFRKVYRYGCFAAEENSSIGIGVMSRVPLVNLTVHSLDVRQEGNEMPSMRPILHFKAIKNGRLLDIFANHWKSKSGGERETEKWRDWQEICLSNLLRRLEPDAPAVILGDFNRDVNDFIPGQFPGEFYISDIPVKSTWYAFDTLIEPGSYYYKGEWSRIDNVFLQGNIKCSYFAPQTKGPWCNKETLVPQRYVLWNNQGYSDHLPLLCRVAF